VSAVYTTIVNQISMILLWANAALWTILYFRWETPTWADRFVKITLLIFSAFSVFAVIKPFIGAD
jgi:hypothetical protein